MRPVHAWLTRALRGRYGHIAGGAEALAARRHPRVGTARPDEEVMLFPVADHRAVDSGREYVPGQVAGYPDGVPGRSGGQEYDSGVGEPLLGMRALLYGAWTASL
ncbi:hypothetical protein [Streptomyces sp. UNOC14_S4]|uniref:hypothetical protein n=1 Tax=Streptomyces sp. UNOC14_S4 TaxID=2872340 RepID=UPI001E5AAA22|nr:hypothetical protein [Streptomyces sp. UNOC14_S4]